MRKISTSLFRKIISLIIIMIGTFSFVTNTVNAQCRLLNEPFNVNPVLSPTNVDGAWYPDRYAPAGFSSDAGRLKISISASDGAQLRPGSYNSSFYNTQGRKFNQCGGCVKVVKADLYIPSDWATKHRRTDMWATAFDNTNSISDYPIMGFANVDGNTPTLRYWDGAVWVNLSTFTINYDTWVTLEASISGTNIVYKVNGTTVATIVSGGALYYGNIIMQAYNFNDNTLGTSYDPSSDNTYDAFWNNLITTGINGNVVTNTSTGETFCSIQAAIDAPNTVNGNTISVSPGIYAENVIVNKSLTILGPNANIDPCSGTRAPEAVVTTAVSDIAGSGAYSIFDVQASNVTIKGFTIDGDNPSITTGFSSTTTADIDIAVGITRYVTGDNLTVSNNIIKNVSYMGIELYDYPAGVPSSGNSITNNKIQDLGTYDAGSGIDNWGGGVLLYNNQYALVKDNCMTNVRVGVQTGNFYRANPGGAGYQFIQNNTIQARRRGIFHNLFYGAASAYTVRDNIITGLSNINEINTWDGILLASLSGVAHSATNNSINGSAITLIPTTGISVWNDQVAPFITGGTITSIQRGINVNNYEGYGPGNANNTSAYIEAVTITGSTIAGIQVNDNPLNSNGATVDATIRNNMITGGANGILVTGSDALAFVVGNTVSTNTTGVNVTNGGKLSALTDQNFITNNSGDGILIDATAGTVGGIHDNDLSGNGAKAINNASLPLVNATCNWYGTTSYPSVAAQINGAVTFVPYLTSGTDVGGDPTDGFQPVPNSCKGGIPKLTTIINNVTVNANNDGQDDLGSFAVCNTNNNILFNSFTDQNGQSDPNLKVYQTYTAVNITVPFCNNCSATMAAFAGASGTVSLVNTALPGTLTMRFRSWIDANNDGNVDLSELASDWIEYTITINPLPLVLCPPDMQVCETTPGFALINGTYPGGTFSGTGVSGNVFTPANASLGANLITYTYSDGNCSNTCQFTITVNATPTVSFTIAGTNVQTVNNGTADPGETATVTVCNGGTYVVSNLVHSNPANRYLVNITSTTGGVVLFDGSPAGSGDITAAQFNGAQGPHTVVLSNPAIGGTVVQVITPYNDVDGSGGYNAGDCLGDPVTITYTANPIPILREVYNNVSVTANNDGSDDAGSFSVCSSTSNNVFLTEISDVQGISPVAKVKVDQVITKTNVIINTAADGIYALSSIGPIPLGRTATLIDPTMSGTVQIKRRAFYDANSNNQLDPGECVGDWVIFTITVNPRPALQTTVNGVQLTNNNDGADETGTIKVCNTTGDNLNFTQFVDLNNTTPSANVKVRQEFILTNTQWVGPTPVDATYSINSYTPYTPFTRHIALVNATQNGTLIMKFRTFYDANNNDILDADECANDWVVYTVNVDGEAPVLAAAPADVTVECIGDVPAMTNLTWTDNFDAGGSVAGVDGTQVGNNCGGTITRTWNVSDACGNPAITRTQIITIKDDIAPVLAAAPADVTVECIGDVPAMTNLTWTDNCDAGGSVAGIDGTQVGNNCGGTITRTWNVSDACGNPAITRTQIITVNDKTPPVFTSVPANTTAECSAVPGVGNATAIDNCTTNPSINYLGQTTTPGILVTAYSGGRTTGNQAYGDRLGMLFNATGPITVTHLGAFDDGQNGLKLPITVGIVRNSDGATMVGPITMSGTSDPLEGVYRMRAISPVTLPAGQYIIVAVGYGASEQNGNSNNGGAPAVFNSAGGLLTSLSSPYGGSGFGQPTTPFATPNIFHAGTFKISTGASCPNNYTITRTWKASDACGNFDIATQSIAVSNNTSPTGTAPAAITGINSCLPTQTQANNAFDPTLAASGYTDNCGGAVTATFTSAAVSGTNCNWSILYTFSVKDPCGNTLAGQTYTRSGKDQTAPTGTAPAAITGINSCKPTQTQANNAFDPTLAASGYTDNCGGAVTATFTSAAVSGTNCNWSILYTFSVKDPCGNTLAGQTYTRSGGDQTPPAVTCPADITIDCKYNAVPYTPPTATDNCSGTTITYSDVSVPTGNDSYIIVRTWKVSDACGNSRNCVQNITVADKKKPTFTCPADIVISCTDPTGTAFTGAPTNVKDNCDPNPVVTMSENSNRGTDPNKKEYYNYDITRKWTVTDAGGNKAECEQHIKVRDNTPPTLICPASKTVNVTSGCTATVSVGNVTVTDNCGPVTIEDVKRSDGKNLTDPYPVGVTTITYEAEDVSGNESVCSQTITVKDNQLPSVSCPVSGTVSRTSDKDKCTYKVKDKEFDATATDNCTLASLTYTLSGATTGSGTKLGDVNLNAGTTTITWKATDASGNTATCSFKVTVNSSIVPTLSCPGNKNKDADKGVCTYKVNNDEFDAKVTNGCGYTQSYNLTGATSGSGSNTTLAGQSFNVGTTTVKWTITNGTTTFTCSFTVTVKDNQNPTISNCPKNTNVTSNLTGCKYKIQGAEFDVTATDNCSPLIKSYTLSGATVGGPLLNSLANVILNAGKTKIKFTATDPSGNQTQCEFEITVVCPVTVTKVDNKSIEPVIIEKAPFNVIASPNPSAHDFVLHITSESAEKVMVRVIDVSGQVLRMDNLSGYSSYLKFGENLIQGTYFAEVIQGKNRKVVKLIKAD